MFDFVKLFVVLLFALNSNFIAYANNNDQEIDSLIKVQKLTERTLLISLGYDAVTAIETQKGIVVIDAGISTGLTSKYRKIIENEFRRNDFIYLINTHGHLDHCGGNIIFNEAKIVGDHHCIQEITDQCKDPAKIKKNLLKTVNDYEKRLQTLLAGTNEWIEVYCQKLRYKYAYNDAVNSIQISKPNVVFGDYFDIDMGDVTFSIKYFGKAHSESDVIVHILEKKILMIGDLFSSYGRPSFNVVKKEDIGRWIKVINWIENRQTNIEIIIDGHGQVISNEDLQSFINNIEQLRKKK